MDYSKYIKFYPDFTTIRPFDRKIIIWEHFGLMNSDNYTQTAMQKLRTYIENGYIPSNNLITTFETAAFQKCTMLESVKIEAQNGEVPNQCFQGCSSLSAVTLNDSVTRIGYYAFEGCTSLDYLEIPATVSEIANSAFQNDSNITIGVWYGSYAYTYAKQKSISYVLLDDVMLGDTDGDGYVNISDVTHIQRHLAELESLEGIYLHAADANQDGTLDISDATTVQMYLAEYDIPYPIGEVMTQ